MYDSQTGEIGYHEVAKKLIKRGYTISKPEVDTGTDIIICKNRKCKQGQIKTITLEKNKNNTTTLAGNTKQTFKEKHEGMVLIISLMSETHDTKGELVFTPSEIPDVTCMAIKGKELSEDSKYYGFLNNYQSLENIF